ncbi:MAG: glycoside hydrolase family 3 protein [Firmicutes bacterium]|nr:glycoside hydrolase family 3 protein [Bacillota bacterium]
MKEEFLKYKLGNMSLSEKIGQMIIIDYRNTIEMNVDLENLLAKFNPGGFIIFKSNIANFEQTKKLLLDIKEIGKIPAIICVDQEGGRVQRFDERAGFQKYSCMFKIGKTQDENIAFELGKKMGKELKTIGINMNMAPVLDIFSNYQNYVISDRAFGSDSETVKKMAFAYAEGLLSEDIIPVGKHFPGHGDTSKDSHVDLPIIYKEFDELKRLELIPFIEAVRKKFPALMVAHIAVPKVILDNTPSSLSKIMVTDLLRKKMGYDGLIIPDSLKMKALSNYYTNNQIYLRTIAAGNDFLLMPQSIYEAFSTIYQYVNNGTISIDRINDSVYRILNLKFDCGFFNKEYIEFIQQNNFQAKCRRK